MPDLFDATAPQAPAAARKPVPLHSDTAIYAAVADLAKYIARVTADLRRDLKPVYGRLLAEEAAWMSVLVRESNVQRDEAKLPYLDEILRQVELIQFTLRMLHDLGADWLPHRTYAASIPLTAAVGIQAMALRKHFAPAP